MEGGKKKHNPYVSANCIRFLGYNLSPHGAPLCLYGDKISKKETEKHKTGRFFFIFNLKKAVAKITTTLSLA